MVRKVGLPRALGLAFLAEKLPAQRALEWGLIWELYGDEEFEARVENLAEQVAGLPTKAVVRTRELLLASFGNSLEQQLSLEATAIGEIGRGGEYLEGLSAFKEKRAPTFPGR